MYGVKMIASIDRFVENESDEISSFCEGGIYPVTKIYITLRYGFSLIKRYYEKFTCAFKTTLSI